jgi:hypothetical protein
VTSDETKELFIVLAKKSFCPFVKDFTINDDG